MKRSIDRQRRDRKSKLIWSKPGTVWAMDHTEIEDLDRSGVALVVRDLASRRTLFAEIQPGAGAKWVCAVLGVLFEAHGAPLVIKSDNGSAFISEELASLLEGQGVEHLRSPVRLPSYSGACESGMTALKDTAIDCAAFEGGWAGEYLPESARLLNQMERRALHASPDTVWGRREVIEGVERTSFQERVVANRRAALDVEGIADINELGHTQRASLERAALRDALCELNYLTIRRP